MKEMKVKKVLLEEWVVMKRFGSFCRGFVRRVRDPQGFTSLRRSRFRYHQLHRPHRPDRHSRNLHHRYRSSRHRNHSYPEIPSLETKDRLNKATNTKSMIKIPGGLDLMQ